MFDVLVCGSLNVDLLARVARLPSPGETVLGKELQRLPGGKGLNQAIAAARMGARAAMVGAIGADADGAWLASWLAREGVDGSLLSSREAMTTGLAYVCVADDGENAIVVHGAANTTLTADDVRAAVTTLQPKIALAQLETPPATVAAFLEAARRNGARTILNTAPALTDGRDLIALADLVVLNETELAHYACASSDALVEASLKTYADSARMLGASTVIVTLGARGALVVDDREFVHHAAPTVEVIDTTGAGDCFCGTLAATLARGATLQAATVDAIRAASLAVTRQGAAPAMPYRHELRE
jgi:ribokinase